MAAPQQQPDLLTQPPIPRCRQLTELKDPDDDWTGITEARDRRRRQNRLNQRAFRKRKARDSRYDELSDGILIFTTPRERAVAYAFMQLVQMQHSLQSHRPAVLPSLIRLNAVNAVSNNALHIGIPLEGLCCDEVISPWNTFGPKLLDTCPESLRPTELQTEIEHHPWVDLLPIPRLRDNMLRAYSSGVIDEDELCIDILGLMSSQGLDDAYLIVWGEAHDARSWEVSEGFLRKWGWLLKGCSELVESTNRWRQQRGETTLKIRI
ncbi:hypothetical protein LB507_001150 [Fusarium sp. FIESC RH6]|nr:hypothetical protein LB507_001150 [Fusarium sp. FIESC RH6]